MHIFVPLRDLTPLDALPDNVVTLTATQVHCSIKLAELVRSVLPELRHRFAECDFEVITVLRDPVDRLCSACTRDLPEYRQGAGANGTYRQHVLEIAKVR